MEIGEYQPNQVSTSLEQIPQEEEFHHPDFSYSPQTRIVTRGEVKTRLGETEDKVLMELIKHPNTLMSASELKYALGEGYTEDYIRATINNLRKKLEDDPKNPKTIASSYKGVGYILRDPRVEEAVFSHQAFIHFPKRSELLVNGELFTLTKTENVILDLLEKHPNDLVLYDTIRQSLIKTEDPNADFSVEEIRFYIQRLRRKIEPDSRRENFVYIRTIREKGCLLYDPDKQEPDSSIVGEPRQEIIIKCDPEFSKIVDVVVNGKTVRLSPMEERLLEMLANGKGRLINAQDLLSRFGESYDRVEKVSKGTIRVHILNLRKKIEPDPKHPIFIISKLGVGYGLQHSKMEIISKNPFEKPLLNHPRHSGK